MIVVMPLLTLPMFSLLYPVTVTALAVAPSQSAAKQALLAIDRDGSDLSIQSRNHALWNGSQIDELSKGPFGGLPFANKKKGTTTTTMTTTRTINPARTAAGITGVQTNAANDLNAFLGAFAVNGSISVAFMVLFSFLRKWFPPVYKWNTEFADARDLVQVKNSPTDSLFGWVSAAWHITSDEVEKNAGLDAGMLIEFVDMCLKIMVVMAVPLCGILAPMHVFLGGWASKEDGDQLSYPGFHNVQKGNWLCWVQAVVCVLVCMGIEVTIFGAQEKFLNRRFKWLKSMPAPRSTTVLVEGIPSGMRSDTKLRDFFDRGLGFKVQKAYMVKNTSHLQSLLKNLEAANNSLLKYKSVEKETATTPTFCLTRKEAIPYYEDQVNDLLDKIDKERKRISDDINKAEEQAGEELEAEKESHHQNFFSFMTDDLQRGARQYADFWRKCDVFSSAGFVTFTQRRDMQLAVNTRLTNTNQEFALSYPPDPSDVNYIGLQKDPKMVAANSLLGYGALAGVFFGFMPFVIFISSLSTPENLSRIPGMAKYTSNPAIESVLEGIVASLALTIFMSLLPTVLHLIFETFFVLKAQAWGQVHVQRWYYYFLLTFGLLAVAVGRSLWLSLGALIQDPTSIAELLGSQLPRCSHWYLCWMCSEWMSHSMHILRYSNLGKFLFFKKLNGDQAEDQKILYAHEKSEPEDQDYYGIGSRTARMSLDIAVAVTFCSFSPIITLLAIVDVIILRLVYGYLLTFQETKKPDMGGEFWVNQLNFLYIALLIYSTMMCGVMLNWMQEEESWLERKGPCMIAGLGLAYVAISWRKFQNALSWETLPMYDACLEKKGDYKRSQLDGLQEYRQTELDQNVTGIKGLDEVTLRSSLRAVSSLAAAQ